MTTNHTSTSTSTSAAWQADSRQANATDTSWGHNATQKTRLISSRGETRVRWYIPADRLAQVEILAIDHHNEPREPQEGAEVWRSGLTWLRIQHRYSSPTAQEIESAAVRWLQDQADDADAAGETVPDRIALYLRIPTEPSALPRQGSDPRQLVPYWFGTYEPDGDAYERAEELTVCDDCGETVWTNDTRTVDGGDTVGTDDACGCLNSYIWCGDCQTYYHENDNGAVIDGDYVCSDCLQRGEYWFHGDVGQWSTEPPDDDEDDDDDDHQAEGMRRYTYHTDANHTLDHRIPQTGHAYGLEVEYKGNPSDWGAVADACHGKAILTNDSTVSGELVSVALTAGQARRYLSCLTAALTGTRNDTETGMHIHADRRALTPWGWFTLAHYIAKHRSTVEAIAGRSSNRWQDLSITPAQDWPTFARRWHYRSFPDRYAGLNFNKGPTVELRVCRATKTPQRALARFGMFQRLIALGRLAPSQRPQDAESLRGWLAQDANIREITGWQVGPFNYRQAANLPTDPAADEPPAPPTAETIAALKVQRKRLEADLALTEQLRYNAHRQYYDSPEGLDAAYTRDARARWEHYKADSNRISLAITEARQAIEAAEALAAMM